MEKRSACRAKARHSEAGECRISDGNRAIHGQDSDVDVSLCGFEGAESADRLLRKKQNEKAPAIQLIANS